MTTNLMGPEGIQEYALVANGGFARVYKNISNSSTTHILKKPNQYHPKLVEMYQNEMEILTKIQANPHLNLIAFLGGKHHSNQSEFLANTYLAFEFAVAGDLMDKLILNLKEEKIFPSKFRFQILLGIAEGLDHLHTQCLIVHRDIKPENIALSLTDTGITPKIIDFGMAYRLSHPLDVIKRVPSNGTYEYVSPETVLESSTSQKSDIYALGIIMYIMTTLIIPFNTLFIHSNPAVFKNQWLLNIAQYKYREQLYSHIPIEEQHMIHDMWAPNPEDRPTARQIADYILAHKKAEKDIDETHRIYSSSLERKYVIWREPRFGIFDTQYQEIPIDFAEKAEKIHVL